MTTANSAATISSSIPPPPRGSGSSGGPCASSGGVRFTLRKRSTRSDDEREGVSLSSYNSDFLSGLFADVAQASVLSELNIPETEAADSLASCRPFKKSRLSLSSYKARASCMNLASMKVDMNSPKGISEISSVQKTENTVAAVTSSHHPTEKTSTCILPKQDSLSFQLSLLEDQNGHDVHPSTDNKTSSWKDVAMLAFPNLPATISDSSVPTGLTRENLARHVPSSETDATYATSGSNRESSFGWFVDLDDDHRDMAAPSSKTPLLTHAVSSDDLAFHAPTAPMRTSDDSEIEWAQAADTVDSVLGDFF